MIPPSGGSCFLPLQVVAYMTPAAVFVGPALAAVRMLAKQIASLKEVHGLLADLTAELAFANVLLLHAGRSEPLAKDHAALLNVICGAAHNASDLISRISRRGKFMGFVAAGSDGSALRICMQQLHERLATLGTAAAVAGAMGVSELPGVMLDKVIMITLRLPIFFSIYSRWLHVCL